ncbi:MAG: hypothetical protein XXXJIFNMEKO3_03208 [Candidatus Erwinia impunctatus]
MYYPASSVNTAAGQNITAQIRGKITALRKIAEEPNRPGKIVVNGIEMPVRIDDDGGFSRPFIFPEGSNSIQVISPDGESQHKTQFYSTNGQGGIPARLRVVLSWDSDNTDLDLHVVTPDGQHAWYGNRALQNGGALDVDVTTGYGPEIFSTPTPLKGRYLVYVNYFGGSQELITTAQLSVITGEGTPDEKQETFVIPMRKAGELTLVNSFSY